MQEDHLAAWRRRRREALAGASAGARAYQEEITSLVKLALAWERLADAAAGGDELARGAIDAAGRGRVAEDLLAELRSPLGTRTAARLAEDMELPLGAVLAAAWALEQAGAVRMLARRPRGRRGLAAFGRAFVELT